MLPIEEYNLDFLSGRDALINNNSVTLQLPSEGIPFLEPGELLDLLDPDILVDDFIQCNIHVPLSLLY